MRHEELCQTLQRLAQDATYLAIHLSSGPLDLAEIDSAYEACVDLVTRLTELARRLEVGGLAP